jgi:glycerol-3-phosphate O-acyltransferase
MIKAAAMSESRPVARAVNRLERFNAERDRILATVERRVVDRKLAAAVAGGESSLEYVINEVAYSEFRRYEQGTGRDSQHKAARWRELANRLGRMSDAEKRAELERLVRTYALDIVGNFNPKVYRFASDVLPPALSLLFAPKRDLREGITALGGLSRRILIDGPLDLIQRACERGTVVVTPTHSSNLDSIAVGFALRQSALPPVTYGAGKNLFTNPLLGFFMHNLGAYRVDRRLKFELYKDVLKEYSTVLLERGYHSLFFPGGTRSRSNHVERHLKLGLLGTALRAYQNNLLTGASARPIYVIPMTLNYRLVLEAETLIEDYLESTGKSRYIHDIEDDEFSRLGRVLEFFRKIVAHEGAVVLRFGRPLDLFGNETDADGVPVDRRGRPVEPSSYLRGADGSIHDDPQRNAVYTRELGEAIAQAYQRDTVFMSTHIVARAVLDAIAASAGTADIYKLLRLPPAQMEALTREVLAGIDRFRATLRESPELGSVFESAASMAAEAVLTDAAHALGTYHTHPAVELGADVVKVRDMKLLYYYANRSAHLVEARS